MMPFTPDPGTIDRLRLVHPELARRTLLVLEEMKELYNRTMRVSDGKRVGDNQGNLYAQGRTAPGPIVTNARPGDSLHEYGLADDCCFTGMDPYLERDKLCDKLWTEFGRIAESHGLVWGGRFKRRDRPHLQFTGGLTLSRVKELYAAGGINRVWAEMKAS